MTKKIAVIGAGPGGYPAALQLAGEGYEVTVVEKRHVGGVCLNCGCIPSKSLLDAAHRFEITKKINLLSEDGGSVSVKPSWGKISARREAVIRKLRGGIDSLFKSKKVTYIKGAAKLISDKEIEITTEDGVQKLAFDACIIAAGTRAFYPPNLEKYKDKLLDNSTVFEIQQQPKSVTIIGGGVIGCEFACMFHALGTEVNVVEMQPSIIPGEDEALTRTLLGSLTKRGIKFHLSAAAKDIEFNGDKKAVVLENGDKIESDEILVAVGRTLELESLNLEAAGIEYTRKGVKVNPETLEAKPGIYAVGDINGLCMLAHAASAQGEVAAANIAGRNAKYNNDLIPKAVYTWPELASVGYNKKQAEEKGYEVKTQKAFLLANGRALAQDESEGFYQSVIDVKTDKILGIQMIGVYSTELINIASVAVAAGMTAEQLKHVVMTHPSVSEHLHKAL